MDVRETAALVALVDKYLVTIEGTVRSTRALVDKRAPLTGAANKKLFKEAEGAHVRACDKRIAANRFHNVLVNPVV